MYRQRCQLIYKTHKRRDQDKEKEKPKDLSSLSFSLSRREPVCCFSFFGSRVLLMRRLKDKTNVRRDFISFLSLELYFVLLMKSQGQGHETTKEGEGSE